MSNGKYANITAELLARKGEARPWPALPQLLLQAPRHAQPYWAAREARNSSSACLRSCWRVTSAFTARIPSRS